MAVIFGIPPQLQSRVTGCGIGDFPVLVMAAYSLRVIPGLPAITTPIPVQGATVTFYRGALYPGGTMPMETKTTDTDGMVQTCAGWARYIEAHINKSGIDFGSGVGARHKIGSVPGGPGRELGIVMTVEATTPPPCSGTLGLALPDLTEISKLPTLPPNIPAQITTMVNNQPANIPLAVIIDGREITSATGNTSIDILSIVRMLGFNALYSEHTIVLEPRVPCNIPSAGPFKIPKLLLKPEEILCKVWETLATVTVPSVLQPLSAIFVSGANYVCKDTGKTEPVNATALVRIGSRVFNLEIRNGTGSLAFTKDDIAKLVG